MTTKQGQPPDDASSAPESGTVRNNTSGNQPSDRGLNPGQVGSGSARSDRLPGDPQGKDDPAVASEER